ncbi:sporulation histidine kinase inhibitor Sda [Bacillus salitolerans]|uniref:Sporulation histidine kinase inhibitor Sda n=1 Tax=Bacillus salitolerans TaxID=1437434 RepID=A0ABW4LYU7_9BACI
MKSLSNRELLEVYNISIKEQLDKDFITLLYKEIERRGILLKLGTSSYYNKQKPQATRLA